MPPLTLHWRRLAPPKRQFLCRLLVFGIFGGIILSAIHSSSLAGAVGRTVSIELGSAPLILILSLCLLLTFGVICWSSLEDIRYERQRWKQTALFGGLTVVSAIVAFLSQHAPGDSALLLHQVSPAFLAIQVQLGTLRTLSLLFLAVFTFSAPRHLLQGYLAIFIFLVGFALLSYPFTFFQTGLSRLALLSAAAVLSPLGVTMDLQSNLLTLRGFTAAVGLPCSGILSLSLFTFLFVFTCALLRRTGCLCAPRVIVVFLLSTLALLTLNSVRLASLLLVGAYLSTDIAVGLFHSTVGAVFFLIVFMGYLHWGLPWLQAKRR